MKKIEIIIRPEKLEELKKTLNELKVKGMTVTSAVGCGNQKGSKQFYRGAEMEITLLHKLKIEVIVHDAIVNDVINKVSDAVRTGAVGDGKIFVYNVEEAVRIRTGEKGETAI